MIVALGNIVKSKLATITYIEKLAGVVKVLTYQDKDKNGTSILKKMPIACDVQLADCVESQNRDLVPDSSKKSIAYLEDITLRNNGKRGANTLWVGSYRLVWWGNYQLLGTSDCSITGQIMAHFNQVLCDQRQPLNVGIYKNVQIRFTGQEPRSGTSPFAKYSYTEEVNQFLLPPYDYFSLLLEVSCEIDPRCLIDFNPGPSRACPQI